MRPDANANRVRASLVARCAGWRSAGASEAGMNAKAPDAGGRTIGANGGTIETDASGAEAFSNAAGRGARIEEAVGVPVEAFGRSLERCVMRTEPALSGR